ncbi:GH92 family glycosyl hydrolase [Massilibacteroides sp.]|uniref:GH92 family glycosyl hydrolase n=1 Tax=Massilibacteroides sp. TaxID=2034766 RepID=UPI00262F09CB|nr:GH92 family glycosyl hydrolase [Massilibacteroides sp.]MDD4515067.1 GH92 family glycosyl hydrolase [Massilibacteroides sp.]
MKHLYFIFISIILSSGVSLRAQKNDLTRYVNTLQGTNSKHELTRGNTYPTTALPWGMNFWTPQTGENGSGWIYQHFKDSIRGFRQTHQCSSWTNDYSVFSLMPVTGQLEVNQFKRAAKFNHKNEIALPHYYKVTFDNKIKAEMSPTERGVHMRFSFPSKESYIVLDAYDRGSLVEIFPEERKIIGYSKNANFSVPEGFANYFVIVFDKPFKSYGVWNGKDGKVLPDQKMLEEDYVGAYIEFAKGSKVQAKVASSFISYEQAELNLKQELGNYKSLEQTKVAAQKAWNEQLNKVQVEGGTEDEKATFYSCFFRSMLFPRKFYEQDINGNPIYYSPYDGMVHDGLMYTDNGFWDTFRAQFPLNEILHPKFHNNYITSLITAYDQSGWLPSWSFPGHQGGMIGNHALSLIADAWVKGFRDYDPKKAMKAMFHEVTNKGPWGPANGRDGWKDYFTLGYLSYPDYDQSTAKTLEYCYDDWCAMQFASMTNQPFYEGLFKEQIYNYKNVFDPSVGFMRGRQNDGTWYPDFDPIEWGGPFTEGAAWHYVWSVFHDVKGLINLIGGDKAFVNKLDSVFSMPSDFKVGSYKRVIHEMAEMELINMGQYAHGNQPIQHMIYLYNYAGQPWKAQKWTRKVMADLYDSTPNGYPGDEDQGQTSAWYVISAMGLYSVCPGTTEYVIGSPVFPKMTINLENGKQLIIEAVNNNSENVYIQSASLNGTPFTRNFLHYDELMKGGVIKYVMGNTPATQRGILEEDKPYSLSKEVR